MKKIFKLIIMFALLTLVTGCSSSLNQKYSEAPKQPAPQTQQQPAPPPAPEEQPPVEDTKPKKNPVVTIEMEDGGIIKVELYPDVAPNTVNNFISLINKNFYNGVIFHRVIPDFMIQGGDPEGTGTGDPGYSIMGEFTTNGFQNDLQHERGVISMARANDPNSAGSQFFIMHQDYPSLDGQYAAFGKVIEGIEVVDKIVYVEKDQNDKPLQPQKMKKVTLDTFGVKYPEPQKL